MNRRKVNSSNRAPPTLPKPRNEYDSNSTDSFDMNDFKKSSLTEKYSVPIHKNNADLMAELNNIMGDESDCEIVELKIEKNFLNLNAGTSDLNDSNMISLNTTHSSDNQPNGEFDIDKQERILAWAQSQAQNLTICVASVLSDHDYLSQELLLGIVAGNEENIEIENQRKLIECAAICKKESNELEDKTNVTKCHLNDDLTNNSHNEQVPTLSINDLNCILKKLADSTVRAQSLSLLDEIEEKTKQLKTQFNVLNNTCSESVGDNSVRMELQDDALVFSPNHSEPLEYNGHKFSTQNSVDETKDADG